MAGEEGPVLWGEGCEAGLEGWGEGRGGGEFGEGGLVEGGGYGGVPVDCCAEDVEAEGFDGLGKGVRHCGCRGLVW